MPVSRVLVLVAHHFVDLAGEKLQARSHLSYVLPDGLAVGSNVTPKARHLAPDTGYLGLRYDERGQDRYHGKPDRNVRMEVVHGLNIPRSRALRSGGRACALSFGATV